MVVHHCLVDFKNLAFIEHLLMGQEYRELAELGFCRDDVRCCSQVLFHPLAPPEGILPHSIV